MIVAGDESERIVKTAVVAYLRHLSRRLIGSAEIKHAKTAVRLTDVPAKTRTDDPQHEQKTFVTGWASIMGVGAVLYVRTFALYEDTLIGHQHTYFADEL